MQPFLWAVIPYPAICFVRRLNFTVNRQSPVVLALPLKTLSLFFDFHHFLFSTISMSDVLKAHFRKFISIDDDEVAAVLSYFEARKVEKKENLLTGGEVCREHYFVEKGILRKFFITEKGVERTTEFAIENWWMTDVLAFEGRSVSQFYIQVVERAEL